LRLDVIVGGLVVVLVLAAGCSEPQDDVLVQLLEDPMASRSQPNARLINADDIPASNGGLIFGKPTYTTVLRSFAPDHQSVAQLHQQLVASAKASGWDFPQEANSREGTKQFAFGPASIAIDINPYVSPERVSVVLKPVR
jgi:hypothetical protein